MERGELPPELEEMMEEFGPEAVAQALDDILNGRGKKRRKRRGGPEREINDFDVFRERL